MRPRNAALSNEHSHATLTMQIVRYLATWHSMAKPKSVTDPKNPRARSDGRKTLLVYMDAGLIKELKKAALDDDRNVYDIVEETTRQWLARRGKKARAKEPSG